MSRAKAIKYVRQNADEFGIEPSDIGPMGVKDSVAYSAFVEFMGNRDNENTTLYHQIAWDLYLWNSVEAVRKMEYSWGFGIRPPKEFLELIEYGYKNGSTLPKFKAPIEEPS